MKTLAKDPDFCAIRDIAIASTIDHSRARVYLSLLTSVNASRRVPLLFPPPLYRVLPRMAKRRAVAESDDEHEFEQISKRSRTGDSDDEEQEHQRRSGKGTSRKGKGKERARDNEGSEVEDDDDDAAMQEPDEDEEKKFEEEHEEKIREKLMSKTKTQGVSCTRLIIDGSASDSDETSAVRA